MSEIIKNRAIVLKKIDFGESSKIATFFTEERGKISAIIKGAKSPKSKIGKLIEPLNTVDIVYYDKPTRDIQIITQVDLIYYPKFCLDNLEKLKYAMATIELIDKITIDNDVHLKLFKGLNKILKLINETQTSADYLFLKFFLFFIKEIGYELQTENCVYCGKDKLENEIIGFSNEVGLICDNCSEGHLVSFRFSKELFNFFNCLSQRNLNINYNRDYVQILIKFLENYLIYHIPEFKGIKSLKML